MSRYYHPWRRRRESSVSKCDRLSALDQLVLPNEVKVFRSEKFNAEILNRYFIIYNFVILPGPFSSINPESRLAYLQANKSLLGSIHIDPCLIKF